MADQFSDRKVPVSTRRVRNLRLLVEKASRKIHSDVRINVDDKKQVLGMLAAAKKELDMILQLEMFSPGQLE